MFVVENILASFMTDARKWDGVVELYRLILAVEFSHRSQEYDQMIE